MKEKKITSDERLRRGTELFEAVGKADDWLIERSERKSTARISIKIAAVAACMFFVATVGLRIYYDMDTVGGLPVLNVEKSDFDSEIFFGGYGDAVEIMHTVSYLGDYSENKFERAWDSDVKIEKLPVYHSTYPFNENSDFLPDFKEMKRVLLDAAEKVGINPETAVVEESGFGNRLEINENNMTISVNGNLTVDYRYDNEFVLPDDFDCSLDASPDDIAKADKYLKETFREIINMDNPKMDIRGNEYFIEGRDSYVYYYEPSDDPVQNIINYNLNYVQFFGAVTRNPSDKSVWCLRVQREPVANKLGDYPIISLEEAKKELFKGKFEEYYSTHSKYQVKEEDIVDVEIIYKHYCSEEYIMPYYKFTFKVPVDFAYNRETSDGKKLETYGEFTVPAVERKYMRAIDGVTSMFRNY